MIYTISNEDIFQVLSSSFSIGPSETGYELQVGADSRSFTTLFSVGANTPRMVTNVANGSYFRLKNNTGNVKVNWERVCSDDSGGGFDPSVLEPYWTSAQTKDYVDEAVSGISLDGYWTSAETQSAITGVQDQIDVIDEVVATSLVDLNDRIVELSGSSVDLSAYYTSAQTEDAISAATSGKADAANVTPNSSSMLFPSWNGEGIITGSVSPTFRPYISINNRNFERVTVGGGDWYSGGFYAPESAGTAGDILVSAGNGAPVWSAMTFPTPDVDKAYVDSAITAVEDHLFDVEQVTASALTELHDGLMEVSGRTVDLSGYYTSAQTEDAISAATSGKANAANVTPNVYMSFPKWNEQGVITGTTGNNLNITNAYINGISYKLVKERTSGDVPQFYAPANAGTAGQILVSAGNGAPVWSAMTFPTPDVDKAYVDSAITAVEDHLFDVEQVTASALTELHDGLMEVSGRTVSTEEIELPIAAAVNDLKGNIEARLSQKYYTRKEVNDIAAGKTDPAQVGVQIQEYVDPAIAEVNDTIEDKELPVSAALNKLNEDISTIDEVIPAAIVDINDRMVSSSTVKTIWRGSQAEYDAITTKDASTLYIIL